jgi:hypothetical protein
LVLILATPSLTSLLDNKALFLPKVLRDVFGKPSERLEVDVVFAVVDRISHRHIDGTKRHTMYGSEGLSIFVTRSKDAAPDLWNTGQQSLGNTSPPSENLATLSIEICYKRGEDKIHNTFNLPVVHIADVPLANTLFLNGQTTTLTAQRWVFAPTEKSEVQLLCSKSENIPHLRLCLGLSGLPGTTNLHIERPPVRQLTLPRVVHEAMGNIIRTFRTKVPGSESLTVIPASEELEALSKYRPKVDRILKKHRHEVWAMVLPRERWSGLPQLFGDCMNLTQGYRLHRVLSGGGGWGNKRGLISLDPVSNFEPTNEQKVCDDAQDFDMEQSKVFGEVIRPGDVVSFVAFLQPEDRFSSFAEYLIETPTVTKVQRPSQTWSFRFGSTPAPQEEISSQGHETSLILQQADTPLQINEQTPHLNLRPSSEDTIAFGHFGCLSSTGCSIRIQILDHLNYESPGYVTNTKIAPLMSLVCDNNSFRELNLAASVHTSQKTKPIEVRRVENRRDFKPPIRRLTGVSQVTRVIPINPELGVKRDGPV